MVIGGFNKVSLYQYDGQYVVMQTAPSITTRLDTTVCSLELNKMLYPELRHQMAVTLGVDPAQPSQHFKNLVSALAVFLAFHRIPELGAVGRELKRDFAGHLEAFLGHLVTEGRSAQTIRDRKSQLLAWKRLAGKTRLDSNHGPVLTKLIELTGKPQGQIAQEAGICKSSLQNWAAGAAIHPRSRRHIERLERFFGTATGTLTSYIERPPTAKRTAAPAIHYRARQTALGMLRYRLRHDQVPESLRQEWTGLLEHKTAVWPSLERNDRGTWRTRPLEDVNPKFVDWFSQPSPRVVSPTASAAWGHFSSFFGFMMLPIDQGGMGRGSDVLTLTSVADLDAVRGYLAFRIKRAENVVNKGVITFLAFAGAIIHPQFGYLTQTPQFAKRAGVPESQWKQLCADRYAEIAKLLSTLEKKARPSRDPFAPIQNLIALSNPLAPIFAAIDKMSRYVRSLTPGTERRAVAMRNLLLIQLLVTNPLRSQNFILMRYRADNSGNLYRAEGGWRLRFHPEDFKNLNGAAKDQHYDVAIHPSVWPTIEEWIGEYRSRLDRTHSDYVFMSSDKLYQGQPWGGMTHTVLLQTRRFVCGTDGICPHAFRNLVATTWLKIEPGSYQRVAVLLHDTLETVLSTYGHMTASAGFDQWNATLSELRQDT